MPAPSATTKPWTTYETTVELTFFRTADVVNDAMAAACAKDPNIVFLGATPQQTGVFGGRVRLRYQSSLQRLDAEDAVIVIFEREVASVDGYTTIAVAFVSEVVAPTVQEAGATVAAAATGGLALFLVVAAIGMFVVPAMLSGKRK